MPHVRRRMLVTLDAPPDRAVEMARTVLPKRLRTSVDPDGTTLGIEIVDRSEASTVLALEADTPFKLPYFGWAIRPLVARSLVRSLRHQADRLRGAVSGGPEPDAPRPSRLLPPASFTPEAAALVATVCALAALANYGGALFGQNADSVADTFGISNRGLGVALAVSRAGVLVSLVAGALADRRGRRRLLLACFAGVCAANLVSALAPGFLVFSGAQLFTRAFLNAALVIGAIAVVEEAPDGARAWALSMFALASGAGFAIAVLLLPLSDLGSQAWRVAFALSALSVVFLPRLARNLRETRRYAAVAARTEHRGRVRALFDRTYGWRFVLVGLAAFLSNVLSAPAAQLTNRFLSDEHGFSNSAIALFRGVTNGLPGLVGIVIAGRLAETRGRRPVGIVALALTSALTMAFFLGSGGTLWVTSAFAIIAAASAGLVIGAFETELFPTEVRGTSNALLLVCAVTGSVTGLLVATNVEGAVGGLGRAIALCGVAPLLAAFLVLPWLPEPADRTLDEISPSEV